MSDVHDINIYSSCLMYYLRSKGEDEFVTIDVKLGCQMLNKKTDHTTAATIW